MPIPIACDLQVFTPQERADHVALARQALLAWPQERQELADGFLFHYQGDEQRFLALARFAADEHRCCPWLHFTLALGPAQPGQPATLTLRLSAPEPGKATLAAALKLTTAEGEQC